MIFMTRPLWRMASSSVADLLDAQQRAVADAGNFAGPRLARRQDADRGGGAVRLLVPFGRTRQQFAVGVAAGDVGEHRRGQRAGLVQPLVAALDVAFVFEFTQQAFQIGAVGILGAERARDLAGADLAGAAADEGEQFLLGGKAGMGFGLGQRA